MLDEPMAGVNPALVQSLLDHVSRLRDEGRTDRVRRARHGRRHVDLRPRRVPGRGQGHRRGYAARGRRRPAVIEAYLGQRDDAQVGVTG